MSEWFELAGPILMGAVIVSVLLYELYKSSQSDSRSESE